MRNIKKHLNDNGIDFEDKNKSRYPHIRFMIDQEIYVVTDYNNEYEICTIDRKVVVETKTQKVMIDYITNI